MANSSGVDTTPASERQEEIIAFLSSPGAFPERDAVERHETHGAIVFLCGDLAYKLKRAVRYPYMDYSTPDLRRTMCEAELAINRRTAPELYLRVQPIVRDMSGHLRLGGNAEHGQAVDWVLVMRRFPQSALLAQMCNRGELTESLVRQIAETVALFHRPAAPRRDLGGAAGILRVIEGNTAVLRSFVQHPFDPASIERFDSVVRKELRTLAPLLEERRTAGFVRQCHGDLHLNNICVFDGRPVLFDAIEFNEDFSCIDVLYDLALLLMDLEQRNRRNPANRLLNRYLEITGDYAGLPGLPLFLACRAAVRAHVAAATARLGRDGNSLATANALFELAAKCLEPVPAVLAVTAGYSGTGKSTLARSLAPELGRAPGAVILRSDAIRKELYGVDEASRLPEAGYSAEVTTAVYQTIAERASVVLAGGHSVVADAAYGVESERKQIAEVARKAGARFTPLWLEAPADVLENRLNSRANDVSDATVQVLRQQMGWFKRPTAWSVINASDSAETTLNRARRAIYGQEELVSRDT